MNERKPPTALRLEIEELEKAPRSGGCETSSSTSPLCTCPCRWPLTDVAGQS